MVSVILLAIGCACKFLRNPLMNISCNLPENFEGSSQHWILWSGICNMYLQEAKELRSMLNACWHLCVLSGTTGNLVHVHSLVFTLWLIWSNSLPTVFSLILNSKLRIQVRSHIYKSLYNYFKYGSPHCRYLNLLIQSLVLDMGYFGLGTLSSNRGSWEAEQVSFFQCPVSLSVLRSQHLLL